MYKIGELSKLSNIPVKTLRFYDLEGLIRPDSVDEFTGYRYYSASKLSDCYRILAMKELGFSLEEIKAQSKLPKDKLFKLLAEKEQELENLKVITEQRIGLLQKLTKGLQEESHMFDIVVRKSEEIRLAYTRRIVQNWEEGNQLLEQIREQLPKEKIGSRRVMIDYEVEYRKDCFDMGLGVEILGKMPLIEGLEEKVICFTEETAGLICREGQYQEAVVAMHRYLEENHYQIIGATYKMIYEDGTIEVKIPVCRLLRQKQAPKNDKLDIVFENDERVIGHWELVDYLPEKEMFHPKKTKTVPDHQRIKELYFLPGGEWYWCFGWTKGYLLSSFGYPHQQGMNPYTVEEIEGETYLFVEMKFEQYYQWGGKPEVWVFRKLDAKEYTKKDIMIRDVVPGKNAPTDDERVLGKWLVCDLVKRIEDFQPVQANPRFPYEALFWRSAEFLDKGDMRNVFRRGKDGEEMTDAPEIWRWTTGNVICNPRFTASMYKIRNYEDGEYIFIQWKSGDYSYGGEEPHWYVFKRKK